MKKIYLLFVSLFLFAFTANEKLNAQTTLSVGDIAFTGYDAEPNTGLGEYDVFSFVILHTGGISSGTVINFTDCGYINTNACGADNFYADNAVSESTITWTATTALAYGTQVVITGPGASTGNVTVGTTSFGLSLTIAGDQVIAYQGTRSSNTIIAAISCNIGSTTTTTDTGWDVGVATSTSTSLIPPCLTNGVNALLLYSGVDPSTGTELDNEVLTCFTATGNRATDLAYCNNRANWIFDDNTAYALPPAACASPLTSSISGSNLICNGVCSGSATVTPSGGTAPYTYSWAPSGGSGATASSLCALNYTCTITDAASTSITRTISITQPSALSSFVSSQTNVLCNGGSNGAATVSASGGAPGYTYSWSPSGGTAATATGLTAQVYTCTITDANSCTKTQTVSISQPTALSSSVSSQTNVLCNGGSNGAATVSASGGAPGYTYSWSPSGGTAATATGLTAQVYTCTITDANACTKTQTVSITQPTALSSSVSSQTTISCNGGSNGATTVSASGGTPGYTYSWSPSGGTAATATGLTAQVYTCTITDANACTKTQTVSITQPTALSATISSTAVTCSGNDGTASVSVSGGTAGYTYSWAPSGGTAASATGLAANTYTCSITDANSCSITKTVTVSSPTTTCTNAATLNFDGSDDIAKSSNAINSTLAADNKITIEAWVNPSNANYLGCIVGNYQTSGSGMQFLLRRDYSDYVFWIDNGTGFHNAVATASVTVGAWTHLAGTWDGSTLSIYVNGALAGTSSVSGTNFASSTNQVWIGGNTAGTPEMFTGSVDEVRIWNRALCQSEIQNNMNCEIATTATGLLANYHFNQGYDAANNSTVTSLTDASGNSNNATLSGFTLLGSTSNWIAPGAVASGVNCGAFTSPAVSVSSASQTNVTCPGGSDGAASVNASGGLGLTYDWIPGTPTGDGTASVSGLTAGSWTCTVTNNCGGTGSFTFTIADGVQVTGTDVQTACGSYMWIDGNTYTSSNNTAMHTLTGAAANGCDSLVTLNLTILNPATGTDVQTACGSYMWIDGNTYTSSNNTATFNLSGAAANGCDSLVTLNLTILNPATGTDVQTACGSYMWIDGNTYTSSNNTATHTLTGAAANGCDSLVTLDLTILNPATGMDNQTACGSYTWIDGNTYTADNTTATFNLVGAAANGCDSLVTLNLAVNPLPTLVFNITMDTVCNSDAPIALVASPSNGTFSGTGVSGNMFDPSAITNASYAFITYTYTDGNSCTSSASDSVYVTGCTGIANKTNMSGIKFYPNPNNGSFTIELSTDAKISILNAVGQTVYEAGCLKGTNNIMVNGITEGVYFMQIKTSDATITKRLIINK